MIDFIDIVNSWKIANNPTDVELELANQRLLICKGDDSNSKCESYTEIFEEKQWSAVCSSCGCPIKKKIFSQRINPCPKNKWENIDKQYGKLVSIKNTKTIF